MLASSTRPSTDSGHSRAPAGIRTPGGSEQTLMLVGGIGRHAGDHQCAAPPHPQIHQRRPLNLRLTGRTANEYEAGTVTV